MSENIKGFERYCRLCAKEQDVTLMLFSTEAADMLLLEKLRKYLQLEVSEKDNLPTSVCIKCCSKLQDFCEFVESVRGAQNDLKSLNSKMEKLDNSAIDSIKEEKAEFTEICIDPMDVLNFSDEESTDVHKLPWIDELVTLKLIAKTEVHTETAENTNVEVKNKYECKICNRSFLVEQSLKNHSWTHLQDEEYFCYTCQKSFRLQSDLHKHLKTHNRTSVSQYTYSCNQCGRRFKTHYTYEAHMQIHRTLTNAYTCDVCGRFYSNWAGLKIHSITHSDEKPFPCTLCDKKFKRNQELKFHMNHHTGAKPYKCKYCNKCFASTGNLYSHRNRLHPNPMRTGLRSQRENIVAEPVKETKKAFQFQCHICKKGCGRQENYMYHMFQHTGLKPYRCTQCTQTFITQRSLSTHYDNVHPYISKPAVPVPRFCPILRKWI